MDEHAEPGLAPPGHEGAAPRLGFLGARLGVIVLHVLPRLPSTRCQKWNEVGTFPPKHTPCERLWKFVRMNRVVPKDSPCPSLQGRFGAICEPRVINVSSGGAQLADGSDGWAPGYCMSKTALKRCDFTARLRLSEVCSPLSQTGLGAHRHGRRKCHAIDPGGSGHARLARNQCSSEPHREVPPGPHGNPVVKAAGRFPIKVTRG